MIIEFEGQRHQFPDDFTDADISVALAPAKPKPLPADPVMDVAKSTGIGAVKGTIGLADIPELGARGIDKAVQFFGGGPRPGHVAKNFNERFAGLDETPDSARIQKGIEKHTGEFYKPQTYAGEWAETIGGFAPAAIGGPGGLVTRLGTQVAAPALASEGAGHLTKGTALEAPSKIAAALLAGPAAARAAGSRVTAAAPTVELLKGAATKVWDDPVIAGKNVGGLTSVADDIVLTMSKKGARERNMPEVFAGVEELKTLGPGATVADVRSVREVLSTIAQDKVVSAPKQSKFARDAVQKIDDHLDIVSPELKAANANYAAGKRSELVTGKEDVAELKAASQNSGRNYDNALRQQLAGLLMPAGAKQRRGFSPEELAQVRQVAEGTRGGNLARYIGNYMGGGGGLGQAVTNLGALYTLGPAGLAATATGPIAKSIGNRSTAKQVVALDEMVRSRSPLASSAPARQASSPELTAALVRALLRGSAANSPAYPQR